MTVITHDCGGVGGGALSQAAKQPWDRKNATQPGNQAAKRLLARKKLRNDTSGMMWVDEAADAEPGPIKKS